MYAIILFFHILVCALLIVVVLMQQTKGAGMSSVFGGGSGTGSLFGGKGATPFFIKLTSGLAIAFFVTSLTLVLLSRRTLPRSAVDKGLQETQPGSPTPEGTQSIPEETPAPPEESPGGK